MATATARQVKDEDVWVKTVCYMCINACSIKVHRVNGVVVKIEGDPDSPHNEGRICAKGNSSIMSLYDPNRLTSPLKRTNPRKGPGEDPGWVEISWDEALDTIANVLGEIRREDPRQLVVSSFDVHASRPLADGFAGAFGTPNFTSGPAGYFCGNGLHPIAWLNLGAYWAEPDIENCRYLLLIGSQFGSMIHLNAVGAAKRMAGARLKGLRVVAVDPVCSYAASKADEWVPIRPGTDAAFALGLLNTMVNELGLYDRRFLQQNTNAPYLVGPDGRYMREAAGGKPLVWDKSREAAVAFDQSDDPALEGSYEIEGAGCRPGFELLKDHLKDYQAEKVEKITSVPASTIRRIAGEFGEAAMIGSKIVIDGREMRYRPACADWNRGAIAHRHAVPIGMAIQLLNTIVGSVNVPGGHLGISAAGPGWAPLTGPDGMLVPHPDVSFLGLPFPHRKPRAPETAEMMELLPISTYGRIFLHETLQRPEKYDLPYRIKAMIHCRCNYMATTGDPRQMADVLSRIPFFVSFSGVLDATAEMADIVLPDAHFLERLDPFPHRLFGFQMANAGRWYYQVRQPVVEPPEGVRHWVEVLFELADRLDMLPEYYRMIERALKLKPPYNMDPARRYTYAEVSDLWARSKFGDEHNLDWFKENGCLTTPKPPEEAFPMAFSKARIHVYHEFFLGAGEQLGQVVDRMGLDWWDISDYLPLPDWKPCPAYEERDEQFDLWVVNYKCPYHGQSYTYRNAWLADLTTHYPDAQAIMIHPAAASRKGLRDGDIVVLRAKRGQQVTGRIRVSEAVHPEVLGIMGTQGHWAAGEVAARGKGVHFNSLLSMDWECIDPMSGSLDACVVVAVERA